MSIPTIGEFVRQAELTLSGEPAILLADRAVWLPGQRALILADLHIGKAMHFRKSGIAVPGQLADADLQRLDRLIRQWQPGKVVFLGDLFHSQYNGEWDMFGMQITRHRNIRFILVRGNHDILEQAHYDQFGIELVPEQLQLGGLLLTHDHVQDVPEGLYNLSGHIHPGFRLRGKGRQSATMPCFHFGRRQGLLPAFGGFTGVMPVKADPGDRVWVIVRDQLMEVNTGTP